MSAVQLNFTLRTGQTVRSVHLVGSWDGYKSNLPLNRDRSRDGGWKGEFRFSAPTLVPGGRYWYYYIIDGSHVSHDPAREAMVEPTTGRTLNILNIPAGRGGGRGHSSSKKSHHGAKGRSLSPSQIAHPYPNRPYETQMFRGDKFNSREMEALSRRYAAPRLTDSDTSDSDNSRRYSSGYNSRSSYNSSPSSVSSMGSPITPVGSSPIFGQAGYGAYGQGSPLGLGITNSGMCTCERYALMRDGRRFRVDCGGKVCGNSGSECSSDYSDSSSDGGHRSKHRSRKSKKSSKSHSSSKRGKGLFSRR